MDLPGWGHIFSIAVSDLLNGNFSLFKSIILVIITVPLMLFLNFSFLLFFTCTFYFPYLLFWRRIENKQVLMQTYTYKYPQSDISNQILLTPYSRLWNRIHWLVTVVLRSWTHYTIKLHGHKTSFTNFINTTARTGFPRLSFPILFFTFSCPYLLFWRRI